MAGLDGLRAVAVCAVIAYHVNFGWAPGGLLGVGVFFVLSGYLITDLLLAQRESDGRIALGQFWLRRARRLLPALWVMLLVVIVWVSVAQPSLLTAMRGDVAAAFLYLSNWWYVFQHVSYFASFGPPSPLGHLWSLGVEEQFYLVWPLLLILAVRLLRRRWALTSLVALGAIASAVAMALLYRPGTDPSRVYYGTDTRAFELLVGAGLALVWPSRRLVIALTRNRRVALELLGIAGLAGIGLMVCLTTEYQPFLYRGGFVLLALAAAAAVAALAHPATLVGRILGSPPLRWIGVRSYGVYLWHFPIIVLTTPVVDAPGPHLVRSALQVGACFAVAALSWRYIEQPIRRGGLRRAAARARAVRWPVGGLPAGLWEGAAAATLVVGFAGAGLSGVVPVASAAPLPELTASSTAAAPDTFLRPDQGCVKALPRPVPVFKTLPPRPPTPAPPSVQVTAIGDSIMIDLAPFLREQLPGASVDGVVSRQMYQLPGVLAANRKAGSLYPRLVLELGTNGPFEEGQLVAALRSLGPMQRIVLVNSQEARPWEQDVNDTLARVAREVANTTVVDWYDASTGKPQWFYGDGVHPNPQGAQVLAAMIAQAVYPPLAAHPVTLAPTVDSGAGCEPR